LILSCL